MIMQAIVLVLLIIVCLVLGWSLRIHYEFTRGLRQDAKTMKEEVREVRKHVTRLQPPDTKPQTAIYRDDFDDAEPMEK